MYFVCEKKRQLEDQGVVFHEKGKYVYCFSLVRDKIVCPFSVRWFQLQKNAICTAITKFYVKIKLVKSNKRRERKI